MLVVDHARRNSIEYWTYPLFLPPFSALKISRPRIYLARRFIVFNFLFRPGNIVQTTPILVSVWHFCALFVAH